MSLQAGTQLGPYRILTQIGSGGMGEVYRARDTKLDRDIALKILPPDIASAEAMRRFEKEARAASSMNHPNIVAIYDVGRHDSIAYIAMELVEGQTLRGVMAEPMPLKESLRVASKIADVLASAHDRGVVHRDLKPENVMISRDGYIKLLDFGLAKIRTVFASGDKTEPQTTAGHVFGTTSYMSPEQAAGRTVDFRSDQFSLGVILYEMIMSKRPFDRPTGAETLTAIIREDAAPLEIADESLRGELQQVLTRCLAKNPADRYASTRDLAHDLRELRNRLTIGSTSGRRSARVLRFEPPRLPVIAAVTSVLLIAVIAIVMLQRHAKTPVATEVAKTLAILPFRDVTAGGDGQLLGDGISEMVAARIAQARGLRVISPFEDAARRRGATMLLRANVQRAGEQLRVSYELVDAASGNRVGGDMVTAPSSELFTLEDYVADGVLQSLGLSRARRAQRATASLSGPDQRKYAEAVGLLQRLNDADALDQAIGTLESLLNDARDNAAVNSTLGRALLRKFVVSRDRGLVDQAAIYAERAVQLDSSEPEAYVTLGELRRIGGRFADAVAAFQHALALQPNVPGARIGLGDAYAAMGQAADAERMYRQALQFGPDQPDVYGHFGAFCYAQARFDEAEKLFAKQAELLPSAPRAFANLGAAQQALGRYDAALKSYQRSIDIRPSAGGYTNLGNLQYFLGRFDDAAASFEKAVQLAPNNYQLWANLGDAYRWSRDGRAKADSAYAKSIALVHDATAVNPSDAVARAVAATSMAHRGDADGAQQQLKLALEADPTNPTVLYHAAIAANVRGDRDGAIAWLGRAMASGYPRETVARDPDFASVRNDPRLLAAVRQDKPKG